MCRDRPQRREAAIRDVTLAVVSYRSARCRMRPDAELVNTMLDAAVETVTARSERPIVHSDRGAYRWPG